MMLEMGWGGVGGLTTLMCCGVHECQLRETGGMLEQRGAPNAEEALLAHAVVVDRLRGILAFCTPLNWEVDAKSIPVQHTCKGLELLAMKNVRMALSTDSTFQVPDSCWIEVGQRHGARVAWIDILAADLVHAEEATADACSVCLAALQRGHFGWLA